MMKKMILAAMTVLALGATSASAGAVEQLQDRYKAEGAADFSAERGHEMWTRVFTDAETGEKRTCETCHSKDLKAIGKQVNTGEAIEPLAPSVNPKRLTDTKFIEKWFKRNCKWTVGRECTSQEKGDFLSFLKTQ